MEIIENQRKYLLISVKPEFANKILNNEKTIELRKTKPNVKTGDYVIIYSSSPVKAILGFGLIKNIIVSTPIQMWENYSLNVGIDKLRFIEYYKDKERSIGIEIEHIKRVNPISLKEIKVIETNFHPPQIYRYISNNLFKSLVVFNNKK